MIASILLVATTVLVAAGVYGWTAGFGVHPSSIENVLFVAKPADLPSIAGGPAGDADSSEDSVRVTFSAGSRDLTQGDIRIVLDGVQLNGQTSGAFGFRDGASTYCTSMPTGAAMNGGFTWTRGAYVHLWKGAAGSCASASSLRGTHLIQIVAADTIAFDGSVEILDDLP
jgi:hypothetical protein